MASGDEQELHRLGFLIGPREDLGGVTEVVPTVDDVPLTDLVHRFEIEQGMEKRDTSYGGLIPSFFRFGPLADHFLAAEDPGKRPGAKTPLLGCSCGEWGCWPFLTSITVTATTVTWESFEQPFRPNRDYSSLGPFRFSRGQYEAALTALAEVPES
jgi:hypothetical protein